CAACHGATGSSVNPEWPNLAGQHHEYIAEQLNLLKSVVRVAPVMNPMAAALSPQDMADLAAHFEAQTPAGLEADPALWQAGQKLYRGGDAARGIPACSGCHGPNGRGNGPARWPQIRGQQPVYVTNQLHAYAAKTRYAAVAGQPPAPAGAELMYDIAKRLGEDDIKSLVAYLQGLR
ncbi:MAG: c-type cytochrome, partial [Proteobacteria bacterium]|nr:c-type cytochrome [Pseudomonadota bacterium]